MLLEEVMAEVLLRKNDCSALINYHGAELKSLMKGDKEYMWCADSKFWGRTAPVLFPFVGAVNEGVFRYKGVQYPMGQHGFARDMDFKPIRIDESVASFVLESNEETRSKYPMDFKFVSTYRLGNGKLYVDWCVENTGDEVLEFSLGAHPAFVCELNKTSIRLMKNGKPVNMFINSVFGKGLLTDKKVEVSVSDGIMKLDEHSFDGDAFVIEDGQLDSVEILDENGAKFMSVDFASPLVGIWSPPGKNAPFLCIEPWYGRADKEGFTGELCEREWNNSLMPGQLFQATYTINIF